MLHLTYWFNGLKDKVIVGRWCNKTITPIHPPINHPWVQYTRKSLGSNWPSPFSPCTGLHPRLVTRMGCGDGILLKARV
jgi:hypothetical protein